MGKVLGKGKASELHWIVTIFLFNQARQDNQTAVISLTTRVKKSDKDDRGKLGPVLRYLRVDSS